MQYKIKQLPVENPLKFMHYDYAKEHGGVEVSSYKEVYSGTVVGEEAEDMLDDLFYIFNVEHPRDFKGHSLSVSDIVELEGDGTYFCDRFGWKKLPVE